MMNGVTFLHIYTEEYYTITEAIMMTGSIMVALATLYLYLYHSLYKEKVVRYMAPMLVVALIMVFGCVASEPELNIYYESTISSEASFEEVYRKFEVVDVRGDIYTLKMKNMRGEYWDIDKLIERANEANGD